MQVPQVKQRLMFSPPGWFATSCLNPGSRVVPAICLRPFRRLGLPRAGACQSPSPMSSPALHWEGNCLCARCQACDRPHNRLCVGCQADSPCFWLVRRGIKILRVSPATRLPTSKAGARLARAVTEGRQACAWPVAPRRTRAEAACSSSGTQLPTCGSFQPVFDFFLAPETVLLRRIWLQRREPAEHCRGLVIHGIGCPEHGSANSYIILTPSLRRLTIPACRSTSRCLEVFACVPGTM